MIEKVGKITVDGKNRKKIVNKQTPRIRSHNAVLDDIMIIMLVLFRKIDIYILILNLKRLNAQLTPRGLYVT